MGLRVDFTNVESFEPIPTGIYSAIITNIEEKTGKTSGLPYLNIELAVDAGEYEGRKLWGMVSFAPKAAFKVKEFLLACGVPDEELTADYEVEPDEYIGTNLLISVIIDNFEGKSNNKIEQFLPLDSLDVSTPEPPKPPKKTPYPIAAPPPAKAETKKPKFK